ncbi:hypothetical protein SDC9_117653 [bioreactor metagenome]|uniref:Uncharacterized protein n=1 Tax=bioreactor metagenome TaxID=1076179 RepID=A0A645BYT8_9ZZZZ
MFHFHPKRLTDQSKLCSLIHARQSIIQRDLIADLVIYNGAATVAEEETTNVFGKLGAVVSVAADASVAGGDVTGFTQQIFDQVNGQHYALRFVGHIHVQVVDGTMRVGRLFRGKLH